MPKRLRNSCCGSPIQTMKLTRSETALSNSAGAHLAGNGQFSLCVSGFMTWVPCSSHSTCGMPTASKATLFQPVGRFVVLVEGTQIGVQPVSTSARHCQARHGHGQ
jgi:hypothetical protein